MGSLRIAQISDMHINKKDFPVKGVFTRQNFFRVLNAKDMQKSDLIVLTGDLAYKENDKDYDWIKKQLDNRGIDYLIMPGNHDITTELAEVFHLKKDLHNGFLFYHKEISGYHLICLDSSRAYVPFYPA